MLENLFPDDFCLKSVNKTYSVLHHLRYKSSDQTTPRKRNLEIQHSAQQI